MCKKDDPPISLEISLIDSVAKGHMQELSTDIAELAIDSVLNDEFLKAIPIVGTVVKFYRSGVSIRDRIFLQKVLFFLNEFSTVSEKKRERFVEELTENAGTRAKAGASLTLLLERLDDLDKPAIVGRLYCAKLQNSISFEELRRFCMIVERAHLPDLIALSRLRLGEQVDALAAPYLYALGLLSITGEDYNYDGMGAPTRYEINWTGKQFLAVVFAEA